MPGCHPGDSSSKVCVWEPSPAGGVPFVRAEFPLGKVFSPHSHDHYVVAVSVRGSCRVRFRNQLLEHRQGDVAVFNPGEIHTGESPDRPWSYRAIYPTAQQIARLADEDLLKGDLAFPAPNIRDRELATRLVDLHRRLERPVTALEADALVQEMLERLILRAEPRSHLVPDTIWDSRFHKGLRRAVEKLHNEYRNGVGLVDLAREAGLSRAYFARAFKQAMGVPPHTYQTRLRMRRAEQLLRETERGLDEIASYLGFTDQSHFSNQFHCYFGLPPGRFRRRSRWKMRMESPW